MSWSTFNAQFTAKFPEAIQLIIVWVGSAPFLETCQNTIKENKADKDKKATVIACANRSACFLGKILEPKPANKKPKSGKKIINFVRIIYVFFNIC